MTKLAEVRLYYTWLDSDISEARVEAWLGELPIDKQVAIRRLVKRESRLSSILGLRLLRMGAPGIGIHDFDLSAVIYESGRKPRAVNGMDFNISHSRSLVVVALSSDCEVGIDAEKIKPLDRTEYDSVMHEHELVEIRRDHKSFFRLWSRKEAIVKAADGDGLPRMIDVLLHEDSGELDGRVWYLRDIDVHESFSVSLATSKTITNLETCCYTLNEIQ